MAYYREQGSYDWYQTYDSLSHLLSPSVLMSSTVQPGSPALQPHYPVTPQGLPMTTAPASSNGFPGRDRCRVLILGCGNSPFGEHLRHNGWRGEIVNLDFSSVVIDQMRKKHREDYVRKGQQLMAPKMKYVCADITQGLPFEDESFDLIICKGTFDAILCSGGSVANIRTLVKECARVLTTGVGCLFLVTTGTPDNRVVFLEHDNELEYYWKEVSYQTVPGRSRNGTKYVHTRFALLFVSVPRTFSFPLFCTRRLDYVYICRKRSHPLPWHGPNKYGPLAPTQTTKTKKKPAPSTGEENTVNGSLFSGLPATASTTAQTSADSSIAAASATAVLS